MDTQLKQQHAARSSEQQIEATTGMPSFSPPAFQLQASGSPPLQLAKQQSTTRKKDPRRAARKYRIKKSSKGIRKKYKPMSRSHRSRAYNRLHGNGYYPVAKERMNLDRRASYKMGMHGGKTTEQKRLTKGYGQTVNGDTHESEHVVGYDVLKGNHHAKRGKTQEVSRLENIAPAYQEVYDMHRSHIGTGNHNDRDESGMNSKEYRDSQGVMVDEGRIGDAFQINQLGYAEKDGFKGSQSLDFKQADDSYVKMVQNMDVFVSHRNSDFKEDSMSLNEKKEALMARMVARKEYGDDSDGYELSEREQHDLHCMTVGIDPEKSWQEYLELSALDDEVDDKMEVDE